MKLTSFAQAYVTCALWSSTDESTESGGEPMDKNYSIKDIHEETLGRMVADCEQFQRDNEKDLELAEIDDSRAGHCFWLNRNGHGRGFWDKYSQTTCEQYEIEQEIAVISRDFSKREALNKTCNCPYHACQRLSEASRKWGNFELYVGDDGKIYA